MNSTNYKELVDAQMAKANTIIALIPDVKPRLAMQALKEAVKAGGTSECRLTDEDKKLALSEGWVLKISPIGARVLKSLFENGEIQQRPPCGKDLSQLDAYISTEFDFRTTIKSRIESAEAYERRIEEIAADPECANATEITVDLIDKVFLKIHGYGHFGKMHIGGIECHKTSTPRRHSNSGKTSYSGQVYCWWIDADGNRQGEHCPDEVLNRRNDPVRNYGLGRG